METQGLRVELGERSYDIVVGSGVLSSLGNALSGFGFSRKIALVSNPTVHGLYGRVVKESLSNAGFEPADILIPDGEEYKNLSSLQEIYEGMLRHRLDRKSAVVALGGGVIGDISGFAASTYMRGIDFIQVPTTLLAQVDSSVGGKTGVNHPLGKNMVGTFWQPRLVWIDLDTLDTLPQREFISGLAEVIKYGVIWDEGLFSFLAENKSGILGLEREPLSRIIRRSCEIKAEVVSKDEREAGLRAILNYGHTIGHAVETSTGYTKYLHGEAVAIGMHLEAKVAKLLGFLEGEEVNKIRGLISSYGLPSDIPGGIGFDQLLPAMQLDKKTVSGELKFILPERIGRVRIESGVSSEILRSTFEDEARRAGYP